MSKALENMTKEELLKLAKQQESKIFDMRFQIDQLNRLLFGAKPERFIKDHDNKQLTLPFEGEVESDNSEDDFIPVKASKRRKNTNKNHLGRVELPDHLPVEEIILEPEEDITGMRLIGQKVTDQLELIPAKFYIKRFIRNKYIKDATESENSTGVIAALPSFPIEKGIAGPGLLAQILIDKFMDHLPIYRQIERFKREKIPIASSTINGWQESIANLLEPLYENLKNRVLSQGYLQVDETPIAVQDDKKKGKTHRGYYWVYYSPLEKVVLFDYRNGRSSQGPKELLQDFRGYLQTDGYVAYDYFDKKDHIVQLNCFAHARRGFDKARDYDKEKAEFALELFQKIYAIEQKAREQSLSAKDRHELRLKESLPLVNELGKWIVETYKQALPKSPIGKALAYCIPRWDKLIAFLNDGSLEIDNNLAENAIRPIAVGRKNYLFAGSHRGAERAAMFYSFFGTCKKNNVNPYQWLKKVLEVIPDHKVNKLHELLPQNLEL